MAHSLKNPVYSLRKIGESVLNFLLLFLDHSSVEEIRLPRYARI